MTGLAEKIERHWFLALIATFATGAGTATAVYEQVLLPRVRLDSEIQLKLNNARIEEIRRASETQQKLHAQAIAELRREAEASFERLPRETEGALARCKSDLESSESSRSLLETALQAANNSTASQRALTNALARAETLSKALAACRRKEDYGEILQTGSPYPMGRNRPQVGARISMARTILAAYSPQLTDSWLDVTFPSGPFESATFYHDGTGTDPTIKFIAYWFRDEDARQHTLDRALCAFGSVNSQRHVEGHITKFPNLNGFEVEIDDNSYKVQRARD